MLVLRLDSGCDGSLPALARSGNKVVECVWLAVMQEIVGVGIVLSTGKPGGQNS